jgi:hypothetical protein
MRASIVGAVFGRLTVLMKDAEPNRILCRCECGKEVLVLRSNLYSGKTRSCGCARTAAKDWDKVGNAWMIMNKHRRPHRFKSENELRASLPAAPSPGHEVHPIKLTEPMAPGNVQWLTRREYYDELRRQHLVGKVVKGSLFGTNEEDYDRYPRHVRVQDYPVQTSKERS